MRKEYQCLHQEMLEAIKKSMQQERSVKDYAESCYWISYEHYNKLKDLVKQHSFKNESEEIEFFRETKPAFTSYLEYYTLLTGALIGEPEEYENLVEYWKEEALKYKRFCDRHEGFVQYYESDQRFKDSFYFKKADDNWKPGRLMSYDCDLSFCSMHDHLVRGLLAHRMYHDYVLERIRQLSTDKVGSKGNE